MWKELNELGLENAIQCASDEGITEVMKIYISKDGKTALPMIILTDAQVMQILREMLTDADYYRRVNLEELEKARKADPHNPWIDGRIGIIKSMSDAEIILNLPKFLRLCIEMLDRGYALEDILFDRPH